MVLQSEGRSYDDDDDDDVDDDELANFVSLLINVVVKMVRVNIRQSQQSHADFLPFWPGAGNLPSYYSGAGKSTAILFALLFDKKVQQCSRRYVPRTFSSLSCHVGMQCSHIPVTTFYKGSAIADIPRVYAIEKIALGHDEEELRVCANVVTSVEPLVTASGGTGSGKSDVISVTPMKRTDGDRTCTRRDR